MKSFFYKTLPAIYLVFVSLSSFAQDNFSGEIEMADMLRSNGKIFVVVAVLAIIFVGIVFYLVRLDRRLSKLEKKK